MLSLISQSPSFSPTLRHRFRSNSNIFLFFFLVYLTLISPIWEGGRRVGGGLFSQEMTLKGNTGQACAACKFQRRKCTPDCPLAPYFPPDQPKMFRSVHRLFGVKKVQKLLEELPQSQHNEAMSSIIYQAEIRDRFPVFGCVEVIQVLKTQIQQCQEELYAVHSMLTMYQQQQQLQLGMGPVSATENDAPLMYLQNPTGVLPQGYSPENQIPYSDSSSNSPNDSGYPGVVKETLVNSLWIQQPYGNDSHNNSDNDNSLPIQTQLLVAHSPPVCM